MDKNQAIKLEELVKTFCEQCQETLEKMTLQMMQSDQKMEQYQRNVDRLKKELDDQIKTNEHDMHQLKQALADLCQSI